MKKISVLLIQLISLMAFGQTLDQNYFFKMPSVAPTSPSIASMEKFGNIPVNYSTGATQISIPVWNIKCGEISMPLSLSYHPSGIKVDERASNVGLGWALIAEGVISRSVLGRPDEDVAGEPNYSSVTTSNWYYLYRVLEGLEDSQMDVYSYNFNGKSGKFLIKQDGSIFQIPYTDMKITNNSAGFLVVDESGIIYTFNKKETTYSSQSSVQSTYTSSWRLTKVQTTDKKRSIDFTYGETGSTSQDFSSFTQSAGYRKGTDCEETPPIPVYGAPAQTILGTTTTFSPLLRIDFPNGYIDFSYLNDRTDITATGTAKGRLTGVSIFQQGDQLIKKFILDQSYFTPNARLKLNTVTEFHTTTGPSKVYGFEYSTLPMPMTGSYSQDKWGFYNGYTNNNLLQSETITFNGQSYNIGNAIRLTDTAAMKIGMLTAVRWPTGGRTEYTYDAHQYSTGQSGAIVTERGGGLRIRLIKNFTKTGTLAGTEYFEYEPAVTLTPYNFIDTRFKYIRYRQGLQCRGGCTFFTSDNCIVYNSGSIYPSSTVAGAPLMYEKVTKYELDPSGASSGKSVYEYDVIQDQASLSSTSSNFVQFVLNDWKNGFLLRESHYQRSGSTYQLLKKVQNQYAEFKNGETNNLLVKNFFVTLGCFTQGMFSVNDDMDFAPIPVFTGSKKLVKSTESIYDNSGILKETIVNNQYTGLSHNFLTKTSTVDSKGLTISTTLKYPIDFSSSGNVYSKMIAANILDPVIERKQFKEVSGTSTLLSTVKNNYRDWLNDGLVLAPETIQSSLYSAPLENKIIYTNYNDRKNPKEVKKDMDKTMSYLWDYNFQHLMVEISNATTSEVAFTSFESDQKGNWTFGGSPLFDVSAPTGKMCYKLGSSISRSGLSSANTYLVSYWKKSGTVAVNGTTAVEGRSVSGWTYYEHKVVNPASGLITVSGTNGIIDELRLYPSANAMMTTFTYDPLIGMTSQCDANNRISYYEYDELQRLILIKDQDRNILKKISYNYSGQVERPNIYYNMAKSATYRKTGCAGCLVGSFVTYPVAAGKYSSTVSQAIADQLAQNEIDTKGPAYAAAQGTCVTPVAVPVMFISSVNKPIQVVFFNNCTYVSYTFNINGTFANNLPNIPEGKYKITITVTPSDYYTFQANDYSNFRPSPAELYDVQLAPSGNTVSVTP